MKKKKFYCNICKKENGYQSQAYPNLAVCKCTGEIKEIGEIVDGELIPIIPKTNNPYSIYDFQCGNYFIKHIKDEKEVEFYGLEFKNALGSAYFRKDYMNIRGHKIYIAKYNNDEKDVNSIMFFINRNGETAENFVLHRNSKPSYITVNKLKKELLSRKLIKKL